MRRVLLGLAAVLAGALLVAFAGGDERYRLSVPLEHAAGLEDGSSVEIAGIERGTVELRLLPGDRVVADLELEESAGPVGRDAAVRVVAANFLGRKRVELDPGDTAKGTLPSGATLPATRLTMPTDLDQVLAVFDADTRTRAQILLNELGEAVVGRRVDIRKLLQEFPLGLEQATPVLAALRTNDRTMHELVERSDRFVAEVTRERRALTRMVGTVGETARTVAARRGELRATLAKAPGTLRTLNAFLGDLRAAARELGPAARELRAAAPPLTATLKEVEPFRQVAGPVLDDATATAPALTRLAGGATPVLRRARPAAQALGSMARALPPVTDALDGSADNVIAILENWSRAIQFRDELGHVFRGEASFSPDLLLSAVDRLTRGRREGRKAPKTRRPAPAPGAQPPSKARPPKAVDDVVKRLPKLPKLDEALEKLPVAPTVEQLQDAVEGVLGGLGRGGAQQPKDSDAMTPLLDLLLQP